MSVMTGITEINFLKNGGRVLGSVESTPNFRFSASVQAVNTGRIKYGSFIVRSKNQAIPPSYPTNDRSKSKSIVIGLGTM